MAQTSASAYIQHKPRYHTRPDVPYVLPNDAPEHARLEEQARHLSAIMNNQILHAPIPTDSQQRDLRLLDVGCGTGIVTDCLGQRFPHAQVFGLDLSPVPTIQGRERPGNVRFLQGDVLSERPTAWIGDDASLPADEGIFDLVFSRLLVAGMPDWSKYIRTAFSLLKPGGYMEIHDLDWIWYDKDGRVISEDWTWWRRMRTAGEAKGLDFSCASRAEGRMLEAGFEDVEVTEYRWPFGGQWETAPEWRAFGDYVASNMVSMVWHTIPRTMEGQGASVEEIEQMREGMRRDFAPEEGKHWIMRVTVGRKPS